MTAADFAQFVVRLRALTPDGYPMELDLAGRQFPTGHVPAAITRWVPAADTAKAGRALYDLLLSDAGLQRSWVEARGLAPRRRLRLQIDADAPELHAIPWELLQEHEAGQPPRTLAAAGDTPFSRYIAGQWDPGAAVSDRPVRLLLVLANPDDLAERFNLEPLDLKLEENLILNAAAAVPGGQLQIDVLPPPATLPAIGAALRQGYHLLHIVAHGQFSLRREQAVLFLADTANKVSLVDDGDFAAMIDKLGAAAPALIFLASCQTATRSPAAAFRGLAPALVSAGVPAVLAMQDLVPIPTARVFSAAFYRQLLRHGQVDLAANEARAAVLDGELPGGAIPVLFSRLPDNRLLEIPTTATVAELIAVGQQKQVEANQLLMGHAQPRLTRISKGGVDWHDRPVADDSPYLAALKGKLQGGFRDIFKQVTGDKGTDDAAFQLFFDFLLEGFPEADYRAALNAAAAALRAALALQPGHIEASLQLAQVLILLTPADPSDQQAVLAAAMDDPGFAGRSEAERARFAQALVAFATSGSPPDKVLLRKARALFELLDYRQWVWEVDKLLG